MDHLDPDQLSIQPLSHNLGSPLNSVTSTSFALPGAVHHVMCGLSSTKERISNSSQRRLSSVSACLKTTFFGTYTQDIAGRSKNSHADVAVAFCRWAFEHQTCRSRLNTGSNIPFPTCLAKHMSTDICKQILLIKLCPTDQTHPLHTSIS